MISLQASPRSPRRVAEDMMRRARETGDLDMWNRGKRAMQYAEDLEARRRPAQVYAQVDHDPYEEGGSAMRRVSEVGQALGLFAVTFYVCSLYFGLFPTAVCTVAAALAGLATFVAYRTVRSARQ